MNINAEVFEISRDVPEGHFVFVENIESGESNWSKEAVDYFQPGDILMVNNNYPHYAGEVQIALLPVINDGVRNKIGTLSEEEMEILRLVNDGDVVIFLLND